MKRSTFLLTAAILSFIFGAIMFFAPAIGAKMIGLAATKETESVLRGLGGLIIGSGAINFFLCKQTDINTLKGLLLANVITHLLGILADVWGVSEGVLTAGKIAPVEITHLFIGIGSFIFFLRLKNLSN